MKVRSYQSVVEKNIVDVKRYLLQISEGYWLQDIHDIVNSSFEIKSIKKKINKKKNLQLIVFRKIKKLVDDSTCFDEIEYHLVFMNILLDKYYQPLLVYKYKLLNYIIENAGFCITTYCLIRHLIKYDKKILESFIETLSSRLNLSVERYHYLASYILLLEGCYKKAYLHLEYVTMDEYLKSFIPELRNYSWRLYRKYYNRIDMPLDFLMV
ncbi:MAG: hypothetical protein KH032_07855 [[Clostridium] spiroforme]|uniref:hypothetical protein n=1 Tax=Thomasclavelia spiroformis TaxID=29348 RepID=UPI001D68F9EF|nr:hypothetical protein [Thomasclavelia spiroformis]MBS7217149.1 hypothetical protein [Thomasclavelia spiroformis]